MLPDVTQDHSARHYPYLCLRNDECAEFDDNGQLDRKFFIDHVIKETRSSRKNLTNSKWKKYVLDRSRHFVMSELRHPLQPLTPFSKVYFIFSRFSIYYSYIPS